MPHVHSFLLVVSSLLPARWRRSRTLDRTPGNCWRVMQLGIGGHAALVYAAKADPYWFDIYWRTLHYQDFYPAQGSVQSSPRPVRPSVPRR